VCTNKLDIFRRGTFTVTIADNEAVGTRQVEYHEIVQRGGTGTLVSGLVSELDNETKGSESRVFEAASVPFLEQVRTRKLYKLPTSIPQWCGGGHSHAVKRCKLRKSTLQKNSLSNDIGRTSNTWGRVP
jgi:hypothetical protein